MSLFIASLNSGSNGNCYYVGNGQDAVLFDAGISCREIEKRMSRLSLTMQNVRAIFVSHEHSDHIRGLTVLAGKYDLPVYITEPTLRHGGLYIDKKLIHSFTDNESIAIGDLYVRAFSKHHDAADPYSFTVTCQHTTVGVFTDIGRPCERLVHHFSRCHAAFLEANYDDEMLDSGNYPRFLKQRIRGGNGHLSNKQSLELMINHKPAFMSHLLLAHLSQNNNCPKLVQRIFSEQAGDTTVIVASRHVETPVFHISSRQKVSLMPDLPSYTQPQLELFFG
jgi:phosphoribosyl 1,2-cyclic phosphodiesterase